MSNNTGGFARLDEVVDFAAKMDIDHLMCRDWSHTWDPASMSTVHKDGKIFQAVECGNCDTTRVRILDALSGVILGNRYNYPEGYTANGMGRIGREGLGLLRKETLRRIGGGR